MEKGGCGEWGLGLDIGTNSVGWAVLGVEDGHGATLLTSGVRAFEQAVEGDIRAGKEESHAVARRQARQQRRQAERRARRHHKVFRTLQRAGLLPPFEAGDETAVEERMHGTLAALDRRLSDSRCCDHRERQVLPYVLRARALDEPLAPHELGRALYHLAQRRGFLSNKWVDQEDSARKENKPVKKGIKTLQDEMEHAGVRTLGEYFAGLDPHRRRIRSTHYTGRQMYEAEFDAIWAAQAPHHPAILTEDLRKRLRKAIFHQRPLKSVRRLVGLCEFERGRRRAPLAWLASQRFRMLQTINNIEVVNTATGEARRLTPDERRRLADALETQAQMTFGKIRALLGLKGWVFNLERGGEKKIKGNVTAARLHKVFGDRWFHFSDAERDAIVEDVRSIRKDCALAQRGMRRWGLDEERAAAFAKVAFENGYSRLSSRALDNLLPLMEEGMPYATAADRVYGRRRTQPLHFLPPVRRTLPGLTNPTVIRSLTEVRRVVNALIDAKGKPAFIRVEMARDLRRSRKDRADASKKIRENEADRKAAAQKIVHEAGIEHPTDRDKEKVLLANECSWTCPYTGLSFGMGDLFGTNPVVDVEHIIPLSRSLDNSFVNKTLCYGEENRNRKRNLTPFEAYGNTDRWEGILQRVRAFKSSVAHIKRQRFELQGKDLEEWLERFSRRQLTDTAYASKAAGQYLALLYGGRDDEAGSRRIRVTSGSVTAFLRNAWGLNAILGGGPVKTREDHRHHAVDAIVVALTTESWVKRLNDAAAKAHRSGAFDDVPPPWPAFVDDVRGAVSAIVVSHRVSRRVRGALHEETIYGPPRLGRDEKGRERLFGHFRKPVSALSASEVERIVDPQVRHAVKEALERSGLPPKQAFKDPAGHPSLLSRDGRNVPIHTVRIRSAAQTTPVGSGHRQRHVILGSNHHVEVLEVADKEGRTRWEGKVVSRYEALQRLRAKRPIIQRDHGPDNRFVFSLCGGDAILLADDQGKPAIFVVKSVSQKRPGVLDLELKAHNDARLATVVRKTKGARIRATAESLRIAGGRKVTVTAIGEVRWAND